MKEFKPILEELKRKEKLIRKILRVKEKSNAQLKRNAKTNPSQHQKNITYRAELSRRLFISHLQGELNNGKQYNYNKNSERL